MRKRFSQILLPVVVLGMCLCLASIALAGEATPACRTVSQDFRSSPFHTTNPLGIAGNFHLVGFSSVTTSAHTNGNILTDTLRYQSNFGTNGVEEVSYIRKIEFLSGGGFSSTYSTTDSLLVVGTEVPVGTADNGNAWTLDGRKVDAPMRSVHPDRLMQDSDTLKYIDLQAVHDQTVRINQTLSTYENRLGKVIEQTDGQGTFIQKVILFDPAGVNVCNITDAHAFKEGTSIECKGFDKQTPGLLILNVDLAGVAEFLLPGTDILYADADESRAPIGEVTEWQTGNVLWNLYDSSAADGLYRGKVRNERAVAAHILAPEADVTLGANLNGTVIARNIDVQAESHRTDLMMFSVDPGGNTLEIPVGKDWQSDETFEVEAVLIRIDVQGRQTECASLRLNESNRWRGTFEEVEKSDADGNEYVYQVKERVGSVMHGDGDALVYGGETYSVSIRGTPADGFLITNRRQGGTPGAKRLSVSVEKRWDLRAAGLAPYPVTIRLYQNGVGMEGRTLTLGEGAWSGSFEDLPAENANGQPYEYTIREIINGRPHGDGDVFAYGETHTAVSVAGSQQEGYVVTNTLWKAGLVAVPVYKTWDLGPGMSGYPVAFELYRHVQGEDASGAVRVENPVCDYGGPYQVEFRDLPKYDGAGRSYVYTVREVVGGESYTDGDVFASPGGGTTAVSIAPAESGGYVVRNVVRRDGELLSVPVRKVWRGGTGAGVTVQLYRGTEGDEKMEGRVLLLGEHNGWEGVFENLQRHDAAGRACTYTVREVVEGVSYGDGDRFVAGGALIRLSIEGDETSGFTVINTVESTKGPPVTGVTSPAALAGAGLLASVAGMSAAWLALRRRRRGEEKPGN